MRRGFVERALTVQTHAAARGSEALAVSMGADSKTADLGGGVRLHYVEKGDAAAPLVVLVHGFPEFWYCWRKQIPALAAAGYRVVAMDMRGYNLSCKPTSVEDYAIDELAGDVHRLIKHLTADKAAGLVGHDWGAAVCWRVAQLHPESFEKLCILNVPHPVEFSKGLQSLEQLRKSWYIAAFQIPWIPEALFAALDWKLLRDVFLKDPDPAYSADDIDEYVYAFQNHPGSMKSAINYYRAAGRALLGGANELLVIDNPVLVLWGEKDSYLGKEMAVPPPEWVPNATTVFIPGSTHWVTSDAGEEVNRRLIDFVGGDSFE